MKLRFFKQTCTGIVTLALLVGLTSVAEARKIRIAANLNPFGALLVNTITAPANLQGSITLPYDSGTGRKIIKVEGLLKKKKYTEAANFLGLMLEQTAAKDSFYKISSKQQSLSSLNSKIREMISQLPSEGREEYEERFGSTARHLVEEAQQTGNVIFLEDALVKYLHTQAGYDALYRLGSHYEDRGMPLEAAFCYSRLLSMGKDATQKFQPHLSMRLAVCWDRAGKREQAKQTLIDLKKIQPEASISVAGKKIKLFQKDQQALAWLSTHVGAPALMHQDVLNDWSDTHYQGDQPISHVQDVPLMSPRWSQLLLESGSSLIHLDETVERKISQGTPPIMPYEPMVIGQRLFMKTQNGFQVFNLSNGKHLWDYPSTDDREDVQYTDSDWSNFARSSLSTNGETIFMVEDIKVSVRSFEVTNHDANALLNPARLGRRKRFWGGPIAIPINAVGTSSQVGKSGTFNTLTARDIRGARQGNLMWIVGGETGGFEPRLAGAFFLGTPLYYGGRLFAIYERNRAIHLAVIDSKKGRLLWSLELAAVEKAINIDSFRKRAGATPAISEGVVLCPTSGGGIVAVDLTMHSLLWAYRYTRTYESRPQRNNRNNTKNKGHWANASIIVAEGKVILSPMESAELHCLDLKTGKALWRQPRGHKLYIAGVHQKNIIIVWATGLSAIKLENGLPAWKKTISFKKGNLPSGRGVVSPHHCYLPMSNGTILQADLSTGTITQTLTSTRGRILGNLIWHQGQFISQGLKYLEVYDELTPLQLTVETALKQNPNDVNSLLRMAQIEQAQGKTASAITLLRQSYQLRKQPSIRSLLITALLEGLRKKLPLRKEYSDQLDRFAVE